VIAFGNVPQFIRRQVKYFFSAPTETVVEESETVNELYFQLLLVFITSLLIALLFYFYTLNFIGNTFVLRSQYTLISIYLGITIAYFLLKMGYYAMVNLVFFGSKKNKQWIKTWLFIVSVEGVLFFPAVLLGGYFEMDVNWMAFYVILSCIIVKLLTIYKVYMIFFRRNVVRLQIFLYFCTLEIVPLLTFWGALVLTANSLKINF
jgi:hypothetical protein